MEFSGDRPGGEEAPDVVPETAPHCITPPVPRPVQVVEKPKASTDLVLVASTGLHVEGLGAEEAAR
jgi:hypothetical protein